MFKELNTLKPFFEEPNREFNVREVARIIKKSPATASKELKRFEKKGILKRRKESILDLYKSNLESEFYRDLKIFLNIRRIKESGIVEAINEFYLKPTIVLFGSCASGLDTETSDIDLAIISENTKMIDLKEWESKLKKEIQIFAVKNINDLKNPHLINNILNGITLQGALKWI